MNRKIILKSRPEKEPLKENFQIVEEDLKLVQPGQVQLKSIYLSLDPYMSCLLYTSPSPRDGRISRMPSSA